jgi:predicted O-methyltransferase YrrM
MNAERALLTFDIDATMCAAAQGWLQRAGLTSQVEVAEMSSLDPAAPRRVSDFFGAPAELIIIDSSHEYASTLRELDIWYEAVAAGGMIVLHDVSRFAAGFDTTREGGVQRAFFEWRSANPEAETICLNADARSMKEPRPLYKDACGVGLIQKPLT